MARDLLIGSVSLHFELGNTTGALVHALVQKEIVGLFRKLYRVQLGHPGTVERTLANNIAGESSSSATSFVMGSTSCLNFGSPHKGGPLGATVCKAALKRSTFYTQGGREIVENDLVVLLVED